MKILALVLSSMVFVNLLALKDGADDPSGRRGRSSVSTSRAKKQKTELDPTEELMDLIRVEFGVIGVDKLELVEESLSKGGSPFATVDLLVRRAAVDGAGRVTKGKLSRETVSLSLAVARGQDNCDFEDDNGYEAYKKTVGTLLSMKAKIRQANKVETNNQGDGKNE